MVGSPERLYIGVASDFEGLQARPGDAAARGRGVLRPRHAQLQHLHAVRPIAGRVYTLRASNLFNMAVRQSPYAAQPSSLCGQLQAAGGCHNEVQHWRACNWMTRNSAPDNLLQVQLATRPQAAFVGRRASARHLQVSQQCYSIRAATANVRASWRVASLRSHACWLAAGLGSCRQTLAA
jgi:hypothetical protein